MAEQLVNIHDLVGDAPCNESKVISRQSGPY